MLKALVVLAAVLAVLGVGMHFGRDRVESAIHHGIDPGLPTKVQEHVWAPVRHGRPDAGQRFQFVADQVTTKRCHVTLGSYSLQIDHRFAFQPAAARVKAGCPGRTLRSALRHATHAKVEDHGRATRLILTDADDHVVLTLQG